MPTTRLFYEPASLTIVDVVGEDAEKIVHNLTTNEIRELPLGAVRETFVTNLKGKTLGHVLVVKQSSGLRLIGAPGQSNDLVAHVDHYTIIEDAEAKIMDDEFSAFVVIGAAPELSIDNQTFATPWAKESSVILVDKQQAAATRQAIAEQGFESCDQETFDHHRIAASFPWFGIDFSEDNLPQELDRDQNAISFDKGCYLGQETVARLDAMGQVQKKLVKWSIKGHAVPLMELVSDGRTVGKLTSVTVNENESLALGMARRSHFEPGSAAQLKDTGESQQIDAEVIALS